MPVGSESGSPRSAPASKPSCRGVGHIWTAFGNPTCAFFPSGRCPVGVVPSGSVRLPSVSLLEGVGHICAASASPVCPVWFTVRWPACSASAVRGVGHNPDPIPAVVGADSRSRNNSAPDLVADRFQVSAYPVKATRQTDDATHVLQKSPTRPDSGNNPMQFRPEIAVVVSPSAFAGGGEGLAGEAACEEVDASHTSVCKSFPGLPSRTR
jgi:hypothetical protein